MITTPNPYLQFFFDFLKRNRSVGYVYLSSYETKTYTLLQYGSDHKYLQDIEYLASLPRLRIYNQVAQQWWQLLAERGLVELHSAVSQPGLTDPLSSGATADRRVYLEPEAEHDLYTYLEQQLAGAGPSLARSCQQLDELYQLADAYTEVLNDRIQQAVTADLAYHSRSNLAKPAVKMPVSLLNVWPDGLVIGKHVDYKFEDGVVVSHVQDHHRQPFRFAGVWIEIPTNENAPLPVQLSFTDSRQQVAATLNVVQSQQLTTHWCLEQGYRQLVLTPRLRSIIEEYGVADAMHPTKYWLSDGQLLVDLEQYYNQVLEHRAPTPVNHSFTEEDEIDLPF